MVVYTGGGETLSATRSISRRTCESHASSAAIELSSNRLLNSS